MLVLCDYGVVGATSSFPDTDFLVYLVCTSTLSSLKWKRHRSVLVKHNLLEIKSVHCLTLTAAPNWGSMPGTRSSLCFFPFQIPGILADFLAGSSIETGQCRWLGEAMFGSQASENHASLIHETQLSSVAKATPHSWAKAGNGKCETRMEMVGFPSSWVWGAQWETCAGHKIHFDVPTCIQTTFFT